MQDPKAIAEVTKKMIRSQFNGSLNDVLQNLHIQTKSKKVQRLIEKASKKLADKVIKSLRKKIKEDDRKLSKKKR
jgi:glucose-6-phosphate-specific signal transduction histidine kinase